MDDAAPFDYLTWTSSISICLAFSIVYVLGLYILSPSTQRYERNHPNVIRRRFLAVILVCSIIYLYLKHTCNPRVNIHQWLGFRFDFVSLWTLLIYPILLTLMLYMGPIIQWLILCDWRYYRYNWKYLQLLYRRTNEQLIFIRNYLIAPFTEGKSNNNYLDDELVRCYSNLLIVFLLFSSRICLSFFRTLFTLFACFVDLSFVRITIILRSSSFSSHARTFQTESS
jgi:hypothetical protein